MNCCRFIISEKASADLENIYEYGLQEWGAGRAVDYILSLNEGFTKLAKHPEIGVSYGHVRRLLRGFVVGSHIIFYRKLPDAIRIVRILHQSMDVPRHL